MAEFSAGDWRPAATMTTLRKRAAFLKKIRLFFEERGVLEVETPLLSHTSATDPCLDSFEVVSAQERQFLLTSPEHGMKRLVAAGSGPVFQMTKAFRRGEAGVRHNPEFSILEWYRPQFDLEALRAELTALLCWLNFGKRPVLLTYRQAFETYAGIDPFSCPAQDLLAFAAKVSALPISELNRDGALDIIMTHCVEPGLRPLGAVYIDDYPASQAALARTFKDKDGFEVAKRFELYINGTEIANAYDELTCATELRRRFDADNQQRRQSGKPEIPVDANLLAALPLLPPCAGIALGLDRLFMVLEGYASLQQVLAFPDGLI